MLQVSQTLVGTVVPALDAMREECAQKASNEVQREQKATEALENVHARVTQIADAATQFQRATQLQLDVSLVLPVC